MKLKEALNLEKPTLITLIGGGGKTTTLFRLGQELTYIGESVVLTTTTAIFMPPSSTYDISIITKNVDEAKRKIKENLNVKRILLGREITPQNKLKGFTSDEMEEIYDYNKEKWFLVEGDGSNGRGLKIPDVHEPQVPLSSAITIILMGSDVLGKDINSENVHRHHLIDQLIQKCGDNVDKKLILDLIMNPLGITKGIPDNSKKVILFNKVLSSGKIEDIRNLAKEIIIKTNEQKIIKEDNTHFSIGIDSVLLGEVQNEEPILEIIGV